MSSESSFDGQTFNEFDDFLPKPLSTDSDSDHVDPEPTGATTSSQAPLTSVPTSSQTSIVPSTPGISESFFSLEIAPVQSTDCSRARKRMGRPHKRIYPRRLTVGIPNTREDASAKLQDPTPKMRKPTSHKFLKTHPHRGYTYKFRVLPRTYPRSVRFSQTVTKRIAATPTGMRILDMGILAEVFSTFRCNECNGTLVLYEEEWKHGWQTFFRVKCQRCHSEHATFPSSRSLDIPSHHTCVNVPFTSVDMNEVTMRSVLATHSTGMSWRDLHKIATIFDMPPPVQAMPPRYAIRLETVTKSAVKVSMLEAANQLHKKVDSEPSPEPKAVNVPISFDSSWKTRGHYSNIGFGAAISTSTKKVLDYEILSRICEKCSIWTEEKQKDKPSEYEKWLERHKPNCNRNYTGSSQAMEPEAAERIWGRSLERNRLVYSVFIGDGDSKAFQHVTSLNPYPLVKVRKEECLTHVAKRLKKSLKKIKRNTKKNTYIQHKLPEWKADYIASNYSTVILQNRGTTPDKLSRALSLLLDHAAGNHSGCPTGEDSWCRWNKPSSSTTPATLTTFTTTDIQKVQEAFSTYATTEFCSHLTLGLTQNANESLHNMIWCLCPKNKYVSPQSIRKSTAIVVLNFNEGELSLFGVMYDLGLAPSSQVYQSISNRVHKLETSRTSKKKSNFQRRRRRMKVVKQYREKALLKSEGGESYRGGQFGAESTQRKMRLQTRGRGRQARRVTTGVKRKLKERTPTPSLSSPSSDDHSSSSDESTTLCAICNQREPDPVALRRVGKKIESQWVCCDVCLDWIHCYCADVDYETVSAGSFTCDKCS